MRKYVTGAGSTLVVLMFSVLCLTIFALISLNSASIDKSFAEASERNVIEYYEADFLAEYVLAEILEAEQIPSSVNEIDIYSYEENIEYFCPIADNRELYVKVFVTEDSYEILNWQILDTAEWETDDTLPVWSGE